MAVLYQRFPYYSCPCLCLNICAANRPDQDAEHFEKGCNVRGHLQVSNQIASKNVKA